MQIECIGTHIVKCVEMIPTPFRWVPIRGQTPQRLAPLFRTFSVSLAPPRALISGQPLKSVCTAQKEEGNKRDKNQNAVKQKPKRRSNSVFDHVSYTPKMFHTPRKTTFWFFGIRVTEKWRSRKIGFGTP